MPDRQPRPFACEDDAREALTAATARSDAASGSACLSLRWDRSGAEGLLLSQSLGTVDWFSLADGAADAEWRLHRDIYRHRRDVAAIVRSRPAFSTALSCLPAVQAQGLQMCQPDLACAGLETIRCAQAAPPGSAALSDHVLAALVGAAACLLAGRGLLVTGASLPAATELSAEVEALARIHVQLLQLGASAPEPPSRGRR